MPAVKRMLSVSTNPTGLASAVAALYAAGIMIYHASQHQGVIDPQVIVAALSAAAFLYTRFLVTPVADPKDGNGTPLAPAPVPVTIVTSSTNEQAAASLPAPVQVVPGEPVTPQP